MAQKFASQANLKSILTAALGWATDKAKAAKDAILDSNGKVKAAVLPDATATTKGAVTVGTGLSVAAGKISVDTSKLTMTDANLPMATATAKGIASFGSGLTVTNGVVTANAQPDASATVKGLVKVGTGLTATAGTVSVDFKTANDYTDQKIADLIGGAPEMYDTFKEIADYIGEHEEVSTALNDAIGNKADKTTVETLTTTVNKKANASTTIAGYGIADAKIANGTITLGTNSITPLVAADIAAFTEAEISAIIAEVEAEAEAAA